MSTEDKMTIDEERKYLRKMKKRYIHADRKERGHLLDEMESITGKHRKALVRLMSWETGSFEFHARLDPIQQSDAPLPVDAAMLEAVRMIDEGRLLDVGRFPGEATPKVDNAADASGLSKLEAAVVDLARAGFTVQRMVDVIPEPDPEIYRALESLLDGGVLAF